MYRYGAAKVTKKRAAAGAWLALHSHRARAGVVGRGGLGNVPPDGVGEALDAGNDLVGRDLPEAQPQAVAREPAGVLVGLEAVVARDVEHAVADAILEERRPARGVDPGRQGQPEVQPAVWRRPVDAGRHVAL